MKRREFITLLGGATAWPLATWAQQPSEVRRIGVLMPYTKEDPEEQLRRAALKNGFHQLGWFEGRNIHIEYRWFGGEPGRARTMASELLQFKPDVIVAGSTPGLAAFAQHTDTTPVVFVGVSDPVGQGFVASLARPGGNATGFTFFEFSVITKLVELLKQIAPSVARVALPFNPDTLSNVPFLRSIEAVAPSLTIELIKAPVRSTHELEGALDQIAREPRSGLVFVPDAFTNSHRDLIVGLAARHRLPAAYTLRPWVTAGGLLSYGVDIIDLWRRAAHYVDRILKGAKPADLPVQQPTKYELAINLKTANSLGLDVPPTLLARADEVIE